MLWPALPFSCDASTWKHDPLLTSVKLLMGDTKRHTFFLFSINKKWMWYLEVRWPCHVRGRSKALRGMDWTLTSFELNQIWNYLPQTLMREMRVLGCLWLGILLHVVESIIKLFGPNVLLLLGFLFQSIHNHIPKQPDLKASCHLRALSCHCCPYTISIITSSTGEPKPGSLILPHSGKNQVQSRTNHV